MHHAHETGGHAAHEGGDHEQLAVVVAHHVIAKEHALADVDGLFRDRVHNGVAVGAVQTLEAMHEGVDAGIEILVARHGGCQARVEQHLIEHGVVAVHAQFEIFRLVADDARARRLGAGAGKRGHGHLVRGRMLHQLPALIVRRHARIGEQVAHAFAGVQRGTAAEGQQGAGRAAVEKGLHVGRIAVHAVGGGLLGGVHGDHHVPFQDGQLFAQVAVLEVMIEEVDRRGIRHGLAARGENVLKLGQGAVADHIIAHILGIAVHGRPHCSGRGAPVVVARPYGMAEPQASGPFREAARAPGRGSRARGTPAVDFGQGRG